MLCTSHTSLGSWTTVKRMEDTRDGDDNNNSNSNNGLGAVRRRWRIFVVFVYCEDNLRNNIPYTLYHRRLTFISFGMTNFFYRYYVFVVVGV